MQLVAESFNPLIVVFFFIVFDILTGMAAALKNRELSSAVMREGLFHKGAFIAIAFLGMACDYAQTVIDLGFSVPFTTATCVYIVFSEIASIIENLIKLNPEIGKLPISDYFKEGK